MRCRSPACLAAGSRPDRVGDLRDDRHIVALALPRQLREHRQRAARVALVRHLPRKRHAHHLRAPHRRSATTGASAAAPGCAPSARASTGDKPCAGEQGPQRTHGLPALSAEAAASPGRCPPCQPDHGSPSPLPGKPSTACAALRAAPRTPARTGLQAPGHPARPRAQAWPFWRLHQTT